MSSERIARRALELGSELAGLTHGHPTGRLAAGAFDAIFALVVREVSLPDAVASVRTLLARHPGHAETLRAIERAEAVAAGGTPRAEALGGVGEGGNAEK